ncbi:MAG: cation-translocating P-type ATPase [Pirellulales bacterium]|nr:cation-translocating P-type ATPase [Pirellulales bacterium]
MPFLFASTTGLQRVTTTAAAPASRQSAEFHIPAMDCPEELALIDRGLRPVGGIETVRADYLNRTLTVDFDGALTTREVLAAKLAAIGFPATVVDLQVLNPSPTAHPLWRRRATIASGLLLLIAAALVPFGEPAVAVSHALAIAAAVVAGIPVARAGWRAIRLGALDMNALMTLAAAGAIALGDYFEAAAAMFLFGVALWLETYSLDRARSAVQSLVAYQTPVAHRRTAHGWEDCPAAEVAVGEEIAVRPGERLPLDGQVVAGTSSVNQAPITGESLPVDVAPGSSVFAGSLNGEGALEIRATREAHDSTLAHISRLVSQARAERSPTARFVDKFARIYTPVVIALAVFVALVPPLAATFIADLAAAPGWSEWLHRGLVLLVIACPCALVISTPVTLVCGLNRSARMGALVKGGEHLERLARLTAMAFDKTGTLTTGEPCVVHLAAVSPCGADEVLRAAAALEQHSEHPLAAAIVREARHRGLPIDAAADMQAFRGLGIAGRVAGASWLVGNRRLLAERGIEIEPAEEATARGAAQAADTSVAAATEVYVCRENRLAGILTLSDVARGDAAPALAELRQLGVRHLALLSGDRAAVVQRLANELGIDEIDAELLPADKVTRVRQLAQTHRDLAMVGDGVNDAPALAAAPVGIALGAQASATALETADVVLMTPRLDKLPELVCLARQMRAILRQNIGFALGVKAAVLALSAAGAGTMWLAVAADVGASLTVIGNGMRLLRQPVKPAPVSPQSCAHDH